jgi:hypothetical protein
MGVWNQQGTWILLDFPGTSGINSHRCLSSSQITGWGLWSTEGSKTQLGQHNNVAFQCPDSPFGSCSPPYHHAFQYHPIHKIIMLAVVSKISLQLKSFLLGRTYFPSVENYNENKNILFFNILNLRNCYYVKETLVWFLLLSPCPSWSISCI